MAEKSPVDLAPESLELGYEARDVNIRVVMWFGLVLAVMLIVVGVVIALLFGFFITSQGQRAGTPPPLLQEAELLPPEPRLQRVPVQDMEQLRAAEDAILNNYGWIDQEAGVVRIPIERAMELTLERGLPARPENEAEE